MHSTEKSRLKEGSATPFFRQVEIELPLLIAFFFPLSFQA